MHKTIITIASLAISFQVLSALEISVIGDSLSPNWAHEYMGTDLVRAEIRKLSTEKIDVAIFDSGFEKDHIQLTQEINIPRKRNGNRFMRANHGTAVANLFNGPSPFGTTDNLNLINLTAVTYQSQYSYAFHRFEKEGKYPRVISNSLGWRDEKVKEVAERANERNILWFLASGNSWPEPIKEHEISSKALLVGSYSPSGLTSFETQSDNRLLVLAAANEELPSIDGKGDTFLFGATSGATPIVAATATNLLSILPNLTRNQVFKIIKETSFESAENKMGNSKAPGLLNAYKAFRVSVKIREKCPKAESSCVDQQLKIAENFEFSAPLLTCKEFLEKEKSASAFLAAMRKSALLGNKDQLSELACAYHALGFNKNAEFYQFLKQETLNLSQMQKKAQKAISMGKYQISYYRYLNLYTPSILQDINNSENLKDHHKGALRAIHLK
jgi:hypothetical protein